MEMWGLVLNRASPEDWNIQSHPWPPGREERLETEFSHQLLFSHVQLYATPWTAAHQASLSFIISWSLLKLMSIDSMMPSNLLVLCHPLLLLPSIFASIRVFSMCQLFTSGGQRFGASTSTPLLSMNIQGWFPLGLTDLICLLFKGLSSIFSNSTVWRHQFFHTQTFSLSNFHIHTWLLEKP